MTTLTQNTLNLMEKIQSLPTERIVDVENFVNSLKEQARLRKQPTAKQSLNFPVISVGKWPEELGLHRKDMYGDDGR